MWYRFETLVDGVLDPTSVQHGFLAAALLEQGAADRLSIADDRMTAGLDAARVAALRYAGALTTGNGVGTRTGVGAYPPADADALQAMARAVSQAPSTAPPVIPTTRRKYWPLIPECLGVHAHDLSELAELTDEALSGLPGLAPRVVVVGIRSAGSVLAPMVAVRLQPRHQVSYLTVRPGDGTRDEAAREVRRQLMSYSGRQGATGPADGRVSWLVVDDPPTSGRTVEVVTRAVTDHAGVAPQAISVGHRDAALRRYRELAVAVAEAPRPLLRRKPPSAIPRTAVRDGGTVLVPFGDSTLGRLEAATLGQVFPALEPAASGPFIRVRWLGPATRRQLSDTDAEALGRSLGRWYAHYRVDPVHAEVWAALTARRLPGLGPRPATVRSLAGEVAGSLLRVGYGQEWWNYRWPDHHDPVLVPGPAGHWSSVVDAGEQVAGALVELDVPPEKWPRVLAGYDELAGHRISGENLGWGALMYAQSVRSALEKSRAAGSPTWRADRRRVLRTAADAIAASAVPVGADIIASVTGHGR